MKNNIFSKIISVFLTITLIFGLFPTTVFAQSGSSSSPFGEVKGFNKTVFDIHFSRADRELSPERWMSEAKIGITQAIHAWELIAIGLYENPLIFEDAKNQLEKWTNEELEYRFSQWLIGRFFGEVVENILTELSAKFNETQKNYSWHLDDEGNIIFDDKTGDPLVIRPDDENREFSQDLLKWQKEAKILLNEKINSLDNAIVLLYPQLLAHIPEELRETMNVIIEKSGSTVSEAVKREFENIAEREERIFTSRRTRDIWSLRKKSDDEAARIFTEKLLAETEEACARGIEELSAKIEEASSGSGDLAIYGDEWLRLYKEQFERGLKLWEEAEERFFIRRIEWEQESFKLFSEGEETWLAAFNKFEEERQKWELKAKDLFNSGELLFKNISEEFEKSIAEAKQEFELNMAMRIGTGTERVKAMVDMYLLYASTVTATQDTIKFWMKEYSNNNNKDFTDPDFDKWLQQERKNFWLQAEKDYKYSAVYISESIQLDLLKAASDKMPGIKYLRDQYLRNLDTFNKKHQFLSQIQYFITGNLTFDEEMAAYNNYINKNTNYMPNLFTTAKRKKLESLFEVQKYYDLYTSYKEKAIEVRETILKDFSELLGTGVLKDILSPEASSEDFCLDEYQIALIRAKALVLYWENKTSIAEAVLAYANDFAAGRMTEAEGIRAWEKAKAEYNESLAAYETELLKMNEIGMEISEQQVILNNFTKRMQDLEDQINLLYNDSSFIETVKIITSEKKALQDFNEMYDSLVEAYKYFYKTGADASYKNILENGLKWSTSEQRETAEYILYMLIYGDDAELSSLAEIERNVFEGNVSETELRIRLAAIDLFTNSRNVQLRPLYSDYSGMDWYSKAKNLNSSEKENLFLSGEELGTQLVQDYKNSFKVLLEKRIKFELEALLNLQKNENTAESGLINANYAAYIYEVLFNLEKRLMLGEGYFTENIEENEIIDFFISGGSFFTGLEQYYIEYLDEYLYCSGLLDIFNDYAIYSSFLQDEIWQNTGNLLNALFTEYSIDTFENTLPDAKNIFDSIFEKDGDFIENTAKFLMELSNCFKFTPQWLDNEITSWKKAIIEYFAANAIHKNIQSTNNRETLFLKQKELTEKHEGLYEYAVSNKYMNENEEERIYNELSALRNEGIVLYYMDQIINIRDFFLNDAAAKRNEKHWRQFLDENILDNYDSDLILAASWNEGVMADTLFNASYYTNRLNDALVLISQNDIDPYSNNSRIFSYLYREETLEMDNQLNSLKLNHSEFVQLGKAYEILSLPLNQATAMQKALLTEIETLELALNALRSEYLLEAEKFINTGAHYDEQYSILKIAYDETNLKRHEYEKQDAIQRWASTAYLGTENIIPDEYKNKLAKAKTVLTVLSDLYNNESRRPYDDPEYKALYSEYEKSFSTKLKIVEAVETVMSETAQEYINNEKILENYRNTLNTFGNVNQNYSGYISSNSQSDWTVKDIITLKDGKLAFSKNGSSMTLSGIDAAKANELVNFFQSTVTPNGELHEISLYESAARDLAKRMSGYLSNGDKFRQWSLAREYLINSLINANGNLNFLKNSITGMGEAGKNGSIGSVIVQTDIGLLKDNKAQLSGIFENSHFIMSLEGECFSAWNSLSAGEKADLEFYIILSLSGNNQNYITGFSQVYTLAVYEYAYEYAYNNYSYAKNKKDKWWTLWFYDGMENVNRNAVNRIEPPLSMIRNSVQGWINGLKSHLESLKNYASAYSASCKKINSLEAKKENGQMITWDDLKNAFLNSKEIKEKDIVELKTYWEKMQLEYEGEFKSLQEALFGLLQWARYKENFNIMKLDDKWTADESLRQNYEKNYQKAEEDFLEGYIDIETLRIAAENAYGKKSSSWIYHLEKLHTSILDDLLLYLNATGSVSLEFNDLGNNIIYLTSITIENRYSAELTAREAEWNLMRKDLLEKYNEWRDSSAQILENGRTDWITSIQKMEEAYRQWKENFQNEYDRVSDEWAQSYLAGLENKEKWLEQAADAAYNASAESMLSLVGTEAERLSRFMDIREPLGIRNAKPEAETLMSELLQASGIANMANKFSSLNNFDNGVSPLVRRGIGSISVWDAGLTKTAASDLAKKTNAEIANTESRKLARNARNSADEAIKALVDNVYFANKGFEENMDNYFILGGLWRRSGNNYVKDIITGSTLFQSVVSKTVTVTGYQNYIIGSISLQTNMDENYLAGLNSVVIMDMIQNVYKEVETYTAEIFGDGTENKIGKFSAHIGTAPSTKPPQDYTESRDSIFYNEGTGELGRLISEYTYWSVIDSFGNAEITLAPWDKRMWDDKGSFFKAPTLRSAGQFATAVIGTVLTVPSGIGVVAMIALNSASDALFGVFDSKFGYKTFEEAAFNIGKSLLINTASTLTSGLFNGISTASNNILQQGITKAAIETANDSVGKVITQTFLTGIESITTGLLTSAISGITYNQKGGLGYSSEIFTEGVKGVLKNSVTSMASAFTSGTLEAVNSGFLLEKLEGFNLLNKDNLSTFNNLAGSLAGQGVNYAFGNDFTLNVLNLSSFTEKKINGGLLELHLGRDGSPTMNIGTGGANVSIENLAAAFKGALVWDVNTRINSKAKKENFDATVLRFQYGFGTDTQKEQLWDILNGKVDIIITNTEGNLSAQSDYVDGKRVIYFYGYEADMDIERKKILAVILGHEAYRDGFDVGETDANGNTVTAASNFDELMTASVARLTMKGLISQEYGIFDDYVMEYGYYLLKEAEKTGNYSEFESFILFTHENDKDYYFLRVDDGGDHQDYYNNALLNSANRAEEINRSRLSEAFGRFMSDQSQRHRISESAWEMFCENSDLQKQYGYVPIESESIYQVGCTFMSLKYCVETINRYQIDTLEFNKYLTENGFFVRNRTDRNDLEDTLSRDIMANVMTELSNGLFNVSLHSSGIPSVEQIYQLEQSDDAYIVHLRVNKEGKNLVHSVMLSDIDFTRDNEGNVTGIASVNVANPLIRDAFYGKKSFAMNEIIRWDIFKVSPVGTR